MAQNNKKKPKGKIQTLRGMRDILPQDWIFWDKIFKVAHKTAESFDYERIDTPILELADLFYRTVGEGTDIVEKEMYTFRTKGRDLVTLRPEFTASIARAFIENGFQRKPKPVKLYSIGPLFRYERPQEGRYRQHHQLDFEAFGRKDALLDVQVIMAARALINGVGIKNYELLINSIGCSKCRRPYIRSLVNYLKSYTRELCPDCRKRLKKNPLRVLDCKVNKCQPVIQSAPQLINSLCEECHLHFKEVLEYLDELDMEYMIDSTLVRGLDYYNRTVFEFVSADETFESRISLGGGGRYDGLVKLLGGKNTPGVGFGIGLERLALYLEKNNHGKSREQKKGVVFLVQLGELGKRKSLKLFDMLQKAGLKVSESFGRGSIKSQLRAADKRGAELALIVGQKEALDETVIVRDMMVGSQEVVPEEKIVEQVKKMLKKKK